MKFVRNVDNLDNVYVWIYMEGCGPCNQVREAWTVLEKRPSTDDGSHAVAININELRSMNDFVIQPNDVQAFPSLRHITSRGVVNLDEQVRALVPQPIEQRIKSLADLLQMDNKIEFANFKKPMHKTIKHVKNLPYSRFYRVQHTKHRDKKRKRKTNRSIRRSNVRSR